MILIEVKNKFATCMTENTKHHSYLLQFLSLLSGIRTMKDLIDISHFVD